MPRLAALRTEEATASLEALGAAEAARLHLDFPDAGIIRGGADWDAALDAAARFISPIFVPELVLAPWRRDPHRDHRDAHALTLQALRLAGVRAAPSRIRHMAG